MNPSFRLPLAGHTLTNLDNAMNKPDKSRYGVLIADDSEADRFLLRKAVGEAASLRTVAEVSDGVGVVAYLRGQGEFSHRREFPIPDLLLLDLNMPRMDGFEVLEWLRTQRFGDLNVVVLTNSLHSEHLKRAMDLGAHFYQVKPRSTEDRDALILALEQYLHGISAAAHFVAPRLSCSIA